jgi:hypothetical protein
MKNLNNVAKDLFNKIRGRFPSVTIGDSEGTVTTVPEDSRFFDFTFTTESAKAGKVSISLDEENGITVIIGKDIVEGQPQSVQSKWFNFLRELRTFAKKRMLNFDVRDINKSNLQKRDYKFLAANRPGDETMAESKMYGTNRTSYQRVGGARIAIKHTAPINLESATSRTQKIGAIYVESPEGERFKYPFRHLSGARAMARHVAEGGNAYDEFGLYISSLSEELSKLRKFNSYMNRSGVMAETLGAYTDIVKERAVKIKKEIQNLQKESHYHLARESFTIPMVEEVPEDVSENWIDQLTIRQFNEELKDVFPYIYRLVGEATKAKELGPDDLEESNDPCWKGYKQVGMKEKAGKKVPNCVPEEVQLEAAFEEMMGQFSEVGNYPDGMNWDELDGSDDEAVDNAHQEAQEELINDIENFDEDRLRELADPKYYDPEDIDDVLSDYASDLVGSVLRRHDDHIADAISNELRIFTKKSLKSRFKQVTQQESRFSEGPNDNFTPDDLQQLQKMTNVDDVKRRAIELITTKSNKPMKPAKIAWFKKAVASKKTPMDVVKMMYDLMLSGDGNAVIGSRGSMAKNSYRQTFGDDDEMDVQITPQGISKAGMTPEKPKTPLGEFILSYFDRETGKFPKGETAVLTAVEKDYGDHYVEPARQFIERVQATTLEYLQREASQSRYPETEMIKTLAGI